jgi:hypothetical protein
MNDHTVQEIELSIKEANDLVKAANALDRLRKNRDFKLLIEDGYFKDEAVRLVGLKADPGVQQPEKQTKIIREIDAIGSFRNYLSTIYQRASWAEGAIEQAERELEEINGEA